jgi:hypothetical protein
MGKQYMNLMAFFINKSLTSCRKKLLRRVDEYTHSNRWKHVWTINGKILLKQSDNSKVFGFTTENQFDEFLRTDN